ncbi:MAG TPA: hypothetical protein VKS44_17025 [Candidatus Acidoferrales bacterium]|nr:hypothetical protein [Candidatus Acidoferrales bacterium]
MLRIRDCWRRWTTTRYTRSLEVEVERLRAENRALLNSILGIAGVPPITVAMPESREQRKAEAVETRSGLDGTGVARLKATGTPSAKRARGAISGVAAPLRRRSWHQINQALELDSAKRKEREFADGPELGVAVKTQ